jgi:hypothetical protein
MNDEQLTRLFRSLDEPAEPRAAFADGLFADLERMTSGATARRRTSVRWLLVAATLLLVASLGAALAIGSGLLKLPFVVVVASQTPQPSATPAGSGTPAPSQSAWTTPTPLPVVIPEPASIDRLVAIPDGFLAIGSAPSSGSGGSVPVILHGSSDGGTWQSIDASRFVGEVVDMAVGPSAWILLANASPGPDKGVVWRSTDGQNWTSEANWTADTITSALAVTAGPSGFAIAGNSNNTVWTSPDGVRWTGAATTTCPSNLSCGWVDHAVVLDKGFIAYESGIDGNDAHVFASLDGATWEAISSPAGSGHPYIAGLLQVGSNLVAITCNPMHPVLDDACNVSTGSLEGSAGSLAIHWQADAAATQQLVGYRPTAITGAGSGGFIFGFDLATYARVVMSSNDGLSWTRTILAADAFGGGLPTLLAAGQSAVVGVGWTNSTAAGIGRDLWRSPDGTSWSLGSAPLVPPAPQVPGGSCPAAPTTVQQLADIGFVKAAACYGNQSLTLQGYSSACGGCGGIFYARLTPDWMAAAYYYGAWYISPQNTATTPEGTRLAVNLLPSAHLTPPGVGVPATVTGHFNDPASQDCRIVPSRFGIELAPTSDAIGLCQRSFVVTSISVTGG